MLFRCLSHPKYVDPPGGDQALPRTHQLHIEPVGSEHARRSLLFRDYLRAHPDRAAQYATLKEQLARQFPADRLAFTRGKGPFINDVLREAADWADRDPPAD